MEHAFPYLFPGQWYQVNLTIVLMTLVTMIIVAIIAVAATRVMDVRKPRGIQNLMEWAVDFVRNQASQMMELEDAKRYLPLGLSLILFLFVANWLGLMGNVIVDLPNSNNAFLKALGMSTAGQYSFFMSPTANMFAALGLSAMVVVYTHAIGLQQPKEYFKHFVHPHWVMLPLNLIEEFAKFLTLGMRLFGNIYAGEVLIFAAMKIPAIFHIPISAVPLFVWLGYSGFVSSIQAFIFTLLTFAYINQKLFREAH